MLISDCTYVPSYHILSSVLARYYASWFVLMGISFGKVMHFGWAITGRVGRGSDGQVPVRGWPGQVRGAGSAGSPVVMGLVA